MLLFLVSACGSPGADNTPVSEEAWPDWSESDTTETDSGSATLDTEDMPPDPEVENECDPAGCIELAEAVDRGYATVSYGRVDMRIENLGPWPVCLDGWYTFLSSTSQDAVAGTTSSSVLDPNDTANFPYAEWGPDSEAWWCIEHNQFTAMGADYTFDGERAPSRIAGWANDASDEDSDNLEDHSDAHPDDGLPQTQHNHWDYLAEKSVFIVGRKMNWFQVAGTESVEVTLLVTNLGRASGSAQVAEKLPPEWVASSTSPEVSAVEEAGDGSTTLHWSVSLDAAVEPSSQYSPTIYDVAELRYTLTYTGKCHGREIGFSPVVSWVDRAGEGWVSQGSSLVLECCNGDDSLSPGSGSGGFGP